MWIFKIYSKLHDLFVTFILVTKIIPQTEFTLIPCLTVPPTSPLPQIMAGFHWNYIYFNWFRKHQPTLETILNSVIEKSAKNIKDTVLYTHRLESLSTINNLINCVCSSWTFTHEYICILPLTTCFDVPFHTSVPLLLSSLCENCQSPLTNNLCFWRTSCVWNENYI